MCFPKLIVRRKNDAGSGIGLTDIARARIVDSDKFKCERRYFIKFDSAARVIGCLHICPVDRFPIPSGIRPHTDFIEEFVIRQFQKIFKRSAGSFILYQRTVDTF